MIRVIDESGEDYLFPGTGTPQPKKCRTGPKGAAEISPGRAQRTPGTGTGTGTGNGNGNRNRNGIGNRDAVRTNIETQEEHHPKRTFQEEYREFLERHGIEFDERYLF
jgi:hypothetical protein